MTNHTDYFRPDALPIHYRDDVAEVCSQSGHGLMAAGCPRGCSGPSSTTPTTGIVTAKTRRGYRAVRAAQGGVVVTAIDLVGTVPPTAGARLEVLHALTGRSSRCIRRRGVGRCPHTQIVLTADQVAELIVALGGVVPKVGA